MLKRYLQDQRELLRDVKYYEERGPMFREGLEQAQDKLARHQAPVAKWLERYGASAPELYTNLTTDPVICGAYEQLVIGDERVRKPKGELQKQLRTAVVERFVHYVCQASQEHATLAASEGELADINAQSLLDLHAALPPM